MMRPITSPKTAYFAFTAAVLAMGTIATAAYVYGTADQATITVTDKERIVESNAEGRATSKYLVFTENEVFENTDSLLRGKFNSSDLQGKLTRGETYQCAIFGARIPFLSMYRNLVSCDKVAP